MVLYGKADCKFTCTRVVQAPTTVTGTLVPMGSAASAAKHPVDVASGTQLIFNPQGNTSLCL